MSADQNYPDFPIDSYRAAGDYFDNDKFLGREREFTDSDFTSQQMPLNTGSKLKCRMVRASGVLTASDALTYTDYGYLIEVAKAGAGDPFAGVVPPWLASVPDNSIFWMIFDGLVDVKSTGAGVIAQGDTLATGAAGEIVKWTSQTDETIVGVANASAAATAHIVLQARIKAKW